MPNYPDYSRVLKVDPAHRREWAHHEPGKDCFIHTWEEAYTVQVFVGNGYDEQPRIKQIVEAFVKTTATKGKPDDVGLCVTVEDVAFYHKDGREWGYVFGVRQYPRFPKTREQILDHAVRLAEAVLAATSQKSALVDAPDVSIWIRKQNEPEAQ